MEQPPAHRSEMDLAALCARMDAHENLCIERGVIHRIFHKEVKGALDTVNNRLNRQLLSFAAGMFVIIIFLVTFILQHDV